MKVDSEIGVAAGAPVVFTVGESAVELHPLTMGDWATLERTALKLYQDGLLEAYTRNAKLLPAEIQHDEIRGAFRRVSEMAAADLPRKEIVAYVRDAAGKVVSDENGVPRERMMPVPYLQWWLTTFEGKRYQVWLSMRRHDKRVTLEHVDNVFSEAGRPALQAASDMVAELSVPQLKN